MLRDGKAVRNKNGEIQIRANKKTWLLKHFPNVPNKELYLHECGWDVHIGALGSRSIGRACYNFHFIVHGKGYFSVNGKTYELGPMMGFILPPHEEVHYCADEKDPWQYYWVGMSGSLIEELVKKLGVGKEFNDNYIFSCPHGNELVKAFEKVSMQAERIGSDEKFYYLALGAAYEIVGYLLQGNQSVLIGKENVEKQIMKYVREHYKTVTINELSRIFYFNRSYIYKIFKKHENCSIKHYILSLRIQEAMRLLSESDMSIEEIAFEVGFNSSVSFCGQFKKFNGMTPGMCRANAKKETKIKR